MSTLLCVCCSYFSSPVASELIIQAVFAGSLTKADRVKDCYSAPAAQKIAKSIDCPAWKQEDEKNLEEINMYKYQQHDHLRQYILETKDRKLLEATSCPFWGVGVGLRSKA